jgi:hypothetical protein
MRLFRRVLAALGIAALVAFFLKARGRGGKPPGGPGWRELDVSDSEPLIGSDRSPVP